MRFSSKAMLLGLSITASFAAIESSTAQAPPLRVVLYNFMPFGNDPPEGFCFDLMNTIAERSNLAIEYVPAVGFADLLPALLNNNADVMCSAMGATNPRRAQGVAYTSAIFTGHEIIVVPDADTTAYRSLEELRGVPVGTVTGTVFVGLAEAAGITDLTLYATFEESMAALAAGDVKAIITTGPGFAYQQRLVGLWPEYRAVETYVPISLTYPGIVVRSEDTALLGILQATLEGLKADGTLATLDERWALPAPPF